MPPLSAPETFPRCTLLITCPELCIFCLGKTFNTRFCHNKKGPILSFLAVVRLPDNKPLNPSLPWS